MTVAERILAETSILSEGALICAKELLHLGSREAVDQALSRLNKSEDIDVTYDVRQIIPELAKGEMPLPKNTSQAAKWRDAIDAKLATWVRDVALPILQKHAEKTGAPATLRVEGTDLFVDYDPLASGYGYVPPS